jgi:hypothetical protein
MGLVRRINEWLKSIDENENDFKSFYTLSFEIKENKEDIIAVLYFLYHTNQSKAKIENILKISCPVEAQPLFPSIFRS